ncbi:head-tail joining protein [Falsiroseomonas sp. CW058]|uniref:head-tail joining protein n=1 Tax=Falsiroseomonas sp. CW058 TaxID=3388664 RepID=UPI003D311628
MDFAALDAAVMGAFAEAVPVTYAPHSGPTFDLPGILDRYTVEVEGPGDGPPVAAPRTTLSIRGADLPAGFAPLARDRVLVAGVTFDVRDVPAADAAGWIVLQLGRIG